MKLNPNEKVKTVLQTFATDGQVKAIVVSSNALGLVVNVENTITVAIDTSEKPSFSEGTNLTINTETFEYTATAGLAAPMTAKPAKPSRPAGQSCAERPRHLND